jgi:flagellar motor switch protein FliN/FliY
MPNPASNIDHILRLEVPIIVRVGEKPMSVSEVTALVPGSIIELPKSADAELDLIVNNKPVGLGHAVKVGENFGIRVTFIGDVRTRLEAIATATQQDPAAADAAADALAEALLAGQA